MTFVAEGAAQVHNVIGMPINAVYIEIMLQMLALLFMNRLLWWRRLSKRSPQKFMKIRREMRDGQ